MFLKQVAPLSQSKSFYVVVWARVYFSPDAGASPPCLALLWFLELLLQ